MTTHRDLLSSPDSARGKLQRICLELLREHEQQGKDGLPTNNRFLAYELIQRGILTKQNRKGARRGDQNLHEALTHLREVGLVPWGWITDETRSLSDYTGWPKIADWATSLVEYVRLDPWRGKAPFVLTESSLALGRVAQSGAGIRRKTGGDQWASRRLPAYRHCPTTKPGDRILYCGDWDWQGHQIENNTRSVLERLIGGELDWTRIALTEDQVQQYNLRPLAIMKADRRYKPVRYHEAIETEALKQSVIVGIIREQLDSLLPEPLATVLERERRQRASMRRVLRRGGRS